MGATDVVAIISGGCLQHVYSNDPSMRVTLIDVDNLNAEGMTGEKLDKLIEKETSRLEEVGIGGPL